MAFEGEKMVDFDSELEKRGLNLAPLGFTTLWMNITHTCNQACRHCHVDASPGKTERMERRTLERCLEVLALHKDCENLDITGGAPELHPDFDYLVREARGLGRHVIVRHNLTVTTDGNYNTGESKDYLPAFFAENGVEVLASLPHWEKGTVDEARGQGVFDKSIRGLRLLQEAGYGREGDGLTLNLVYNQDGPLSAQDRDRLEAEFKRELAERYGLFFHRLITVTNMPVNRYLACLREAGTYEDYMEKLVTAFDPEAAKTVVCRRLVSVSCDGMLYDCDFNQALGLPLNTNTPAMIFNFDIDEILNRRINFARHCFGCACGGSS